MSLNDITNPSINFLDAHIDSWIIKAGTVLSPGHYPDLSGPHIAPRHPPTLPLDVPPQWPPRVALTGGITTEEPVIGITLIGPQ